MNKCTAVGAELEAKEQSECTRHGKEGQGRAGPGRDGLGRACVGGRGDRESGGGIRVWGQASGVERGKECVSGAVCVVWWFVSGKQEMWGCKVHVRKLRQGCY